MRVCCSVRSISKSSGDEPHGRAGAVAGDGVAHRPLDRQGERVAELVGLRLVGALVAGARPVEAVIAGAVLLELAVQVGEGVLADATDAARRELVAALAVLDEPRLLEHAGHLGHAVEALGGVVAEELAGAVDVDLGEGTGVGRAAEQVLELVHVAEALHQLGRLGHVERIGAGEVVATVPAHLREQRAQVPAELVDLPAQVHVLEQLLGRAGAADRAAPASSS